MPHVIFLHSALTGGRIIAQDPEQARRIFRFEVLDVTVAMGIAGLVNGAMLVTAAATFYRHGLFEIASLEEAHRTLTPLLGPASSAIFAVALLASGLSSSTVGTLSGQVIMQGFLRRRIPLWLRRLVTMVPAIVVIGLGLDPTRTLVLSQVVLSFGLPFALVPLVLFTARPDLMGILVNRRATTAVAWLVTLLISALNVYLLVLLTRGG
jgi:manganese transport protein